MSFRLPLATLLCVLEGQLLLKKAAATLSVILAISMVLLGGWLIVSLILYGLTMLGWVWILRHAPLYLTYPFMELTLLIVPAVAWLFLGELLWHGRYPASSTMYQIDHRMATLRPQNREKLDAFALHWFVCGVNWIPLFAYNDRWNINSLSAWPWPPQVENSAMHTAAIPCYNKSTQRVSGAIEANSPMIIKTIIHRI